MAKTIEIVTFRLADGVSDEAFIAETKTMERDFLGKLPGFIDRDTGKSAEGGWIVVLHWASAEDAQASMNKFVDAPGTKAFTACIDMSTFQMVRYRLEDFYKLSTDDAAA
ncbi:hypothetical protein [Salipiger aestuarii]|uniref:Antibiotic biosynthesis monooxygenase n=1 Tax=Salipiger aestuarii TaxID=568098 RepID=A0A327YGK7_9RHOB|nr:hypothetical protein [Salipiger aestuarii]EIE49281.1 hypothetical protein C357_19663 [Citreicella sp. 357]RAK19631.1 hypothetical protein ATI53_100813 [Salipiger aestuarii]